jgi:hypothetical protein
VRFPGVLGPPYVPAVTKKAGKVPPLLEFEMHVARRFEIAKLAKFNKCLFLGSPILGHFCPIWGHFPILGP